VCGLESPGNSLTKKPTVTVFGSARPIDGDVYYEEARSVGRALASAGYIVCNGGYGGSMEASARGAKEAGGETIGVVSSFFSIETNRWIDRKVIMPTLMERLDALIEHGDGYVVLRGGTGTLLEFAAVWELINKKVMAEKPIVVFGESWNTVIETLNSELAFEGKDWCTDYVRVARTTDELIILLKTKIKG
jgi:uncharacterized protein (TIGR00730 family)